MNKSVSTDLSNLASDTTVGRLMIYLSDVKVNDHVARESPTNQYEQSIGGY